MTKCRLQGLLRPLFNEIPILLRRSFSVGEKAEITRIFTQEDVEKFSLLCGDTNPIHLDPEFARQSKFGQRIVHGALINGLVSALLGTKLPGPGTVVVNQMLHFQSPLYINEPVVASVEITSIKKTIMECIFTCSAKNRNVVVMSGSVKLFLTRHHLE